MSMGPEHDEHVNLCRRCIGWRFSETDGSLKIQLKRKKKGREEGSVQRNGDMEIFFK